MNENVLQMIDTLHARLDDVSEAVKSLPIEAPEYATKLDKIDDKLYLLQCEIEKVTQSSSVTESKKAETSDEEELVASDQTKTSQATSADDLSEQTDAASSQKETSKESDTEKSSEDSSEGEKKKEIFSDDMKENLADAGRAIGNIYRDGKEVITELSGTMGDLKDIFSFGKKR